MLGIYLGGIQEVLSKGIAVLLIALVLDYIKDSVLETGETYVSILGTFASKRETALTLIFFALSGSYISGRAQEWLVTFFLRSNNILIAIGLGIWGVLIMTNRQAQSWKLFSGDDPVLLVMAIAGTSMILLPVL